MCLNNSRRTSKLHHSEAIILAGGLGTRLRSVIPDLPKPMAPVNGKPFLEYLMDFWISQGVVHFVLAVGYKYQAVVDHFGGSYRGIPIDYSIESEPIGTGGGLFLAFERISSREPFYVINGDTFFPIDSNSVFKFHSMMKSEFTMVLREMSSAERYGTVRLEKDKRIIQFCSPGQGHPPFLINGGVYLIEPEFLTDTYSKGLFKGPISLEDVLFPKWVQENKSLYGYIEKNNSFLDIGIPSDYERSQSFFIQ